jgi:hypothetical protein
MKRFLKLIATILVFLPCLSTNLSCSKTSSHDLSQVNSSVSGLLMGKQWMVNSNYTNYTGPATGTLVYQRGGTNNTQHLDSYFIIFKPDSIQFFINTETSSNYFYTFLSSDSTELLINSNTADYARIVELNANQLTIFDSTNSELTFYITKP